MITVNENYLKLKASYLFAEIARRLNDYVRNNPSAKIIRMGIGDVTLPLPKVCIAALHKATDEMANQATFRGYDDGGIGYLFLREAIAAVDFKQRGAQVSPDEIFVSDGAKCDTANIQELFSQNIRVAIPDPVYPVYLDTNVMAGRTGAFDETTGRYPGITYMECNQENGFVPALPGQKADLIYLCFPNNPTGATITKAQLSQWVAYARKNKALILYDAAYAEFLRDPILPRSIFEIEGAREVAIESRSLSKTAGFTGTRCAYLVIPRECVAYDASGTAHSLQKLWTRRHTTKFNGVSYPVQRAAEAVFTPEGQRQIREMSNYYLENGKKVRSVFSSLGYACTGGENSPYIWINTNRDSWEFFDLMLAQAHVVCTPGAGFGTCGRGYVRFSAFNMHEKVEEAMERIKKVLR
jgi:LL-diaminopimelate aminotransferase